MSNCHNNFKKGDVIYIELFMYEMFYVDMTGTRFNKILVLVTHVFSVKTTSLAFFKKILSSLEQTLNSNKLSKQMYM